LRRDVETLGDDRYLAPDIEAATELVRAGALLENVDDEVFPALHT